MIEYQKLGIFNSSVRRYEFNPRQLFKGQAVA